YLRPLSYEVLFSGLPPFPPRIALHLLSPHSRLASCGTRQHLPPKPAAAYHRAGSGEDRPRTVEPEALRDWHRMFWCAPGGGAVLRTARASRRACPTAISRVRSAFVSALATSPGKTEGASRSWTWRW